MRFCKKNDKPKQPSKKKKNQQEIVAVNVTLTHFSLRLDKLLSSKTQRTVIMNVGVGNSGGDWS